MNAPSWVSPYSPAPPFSAPSSAPEAAMHTLKRARDVVSNLPRRWPNLPRRWPRRWMTAEGDQEGDQGRPPSSIRNFNTPAGFSPRGSSFPHYLIHHGAHFGLRCRLYAVSLLQFLFCFRPLLFLLGLFLFVPGTKIPHRRRQERRGPRADPFPAQDPLGARDLQEFRKGLRPQFPGKRGYYIYIN